MEKHKNLGFTILFFTSRGGKKVQERVSFISSIPHSVSSSVSLLSAELILSLSSCFIPFHFIHIQQSIIFRKKNKEGVRAREASREKSGDCRWKWYFFSSCSYPSAFELAMWKSARSTALHSSLPLIKSRQSGLNQHAKCHSTL